MLRQAVGKLLRPEFHHFKRPLIQGDGSTCTSASRSTTSCLPKTGTKFRCFNAALAEVQRWNCNKPGRADEESGGRPDQRQVCTLEPLSDVPGNSKGLFQAQQLDWFLSRDRRGTTAGVRFDRQAFPSTML